MEVSDSFSHVSALLASLHNSITPFSLHSVGVTIPSFQADKTADMMGTGGRRGNYDDSGTVRATRNWIRVG